MAGLAAALAGCRAEPTEHVAEPTPPTVAEPAGRRASYGTVEIPSHAATAPCTSRVHIEHCVAQLMREGTVHCDPAAEPVPVSWSGPPGNASNAPRPGGAWVELEARVSPSGAPQGLRVVAAAPPGGLEARAIEAFKRWRYCPKPHRGKPVRARIEFPPPP